MNNYKKKILKYRLQLLFVSFIILGFASYITWNAVNDKNKAIAFSQLEIDGAKTLPAVKDLLVNTLKLRGLIASYKAGDITLHPQIKEEILVIKTKLNIAKQAIEKANLKGIAPLFELLNAHLQNTINTALTNSKQKSFQLHSGDIDTEIALIIKIGDMSNLILDPDLDTFYLMDAVVNKLPSVIKSVGKLRGIGSAVLMSKEINKNTQIQLAVLLGSLEDTTAAAQSGLNSAYSYNDSLKPVINPSLKKLSVDVNKFESEVQKIVKGNFSVNSTNYFQIATDIIYNTASLYDLSNKHLLRLLNIRVDEMKVARDMVIVEGTIFLLILISLFYVAYDYLYKSLLVREAEKKEQAILEELEKTNSSLMYALTHNTLTGLYNRNSLVKDITNFKHNAIIMLIDIRAFKEINDVYGNSFGDRVLVDFTEYLKHFFVNLNGITLYKTGGDEFAVLVTNKSVDEVMKIGKDLEEAIRNQNFKIDNIRTNLSVNIAINSVAPLLENADLALKALKKDMNRHIIEYKEELSVKKEWKKNIEVINMVKSALVEDRIVPYFQGIVNLRTMRIEKYEVLVRLILPSGEVLSPYAFLDTVSKTHYYYDITKVMIKKTMEMAKTHPAQRFSINFSMKDITNENIIHTLFELFDADKETAKRIDIELLETELVAVDDSRINDFIIKVHSYGSKILIDDFGTGYSNFSYLSDLDVDIIKIDASIIKEITSDTRKLHIAQTIHNFTSGMKMQNVAEFVETKEVALRLKEMGVEYAQGYLFSKPLPELLKNSDVSESV